MSWSESALSRPSQGARLCEEPKGPALGHLELRNEDLERSSCSLELGSALKERALRDRSASSKCPDPPTQEP